MCFGSKIAKEGDFGKISFVDKLSLGNRRPGTNLQLLEIRI